MNDKQFWILIAVIVCIGAAIVFGMTPSNKNVTSSEVTWTGCNFIGMNKGGIQVFTVEIGIDEHGNIKVRNFEQSTTEHQTSSETWSY